MNSGVSPFLHNAYARRRLRADRATRALLTPVGLVIQLAAIGLALALTSSFTSPVAWALGVTVAILGSSGQIGVALVVAIVIQASPAISLLNELGPLPASTFYLSTTLVLVVVVAIQSTMGLRPQRAQFATCALVLVFATWSYLKVTEHSYASNLGPASPSIGFGSTAVVASLAVLALTATITLAPPFSRSALLWGVGLIGSIGGATQSALHLGNPIWVSRACALGILALLLVRGMPLLLRATLISVSVLTMVGLDKQGPILALAVGTVVLILQSRRTISSRFVVGLAVVVFGSAALLAWLTTINNWLDSDGNATARLDFWSRAIADVALEPVWGGGFGIFPRGVGTYPHNVVLEILLGLGFLGFILWAVVVWRLIRASAASGLEPLLAAALTFAAFSGAFPSNPEYWLVGAASAALAQPSGDPRTRNFSIEAASPPRISGT